jgi:hypothetical protein
LESDNILLPALENKMHLESYLEKMYAYELFTFKEGN